MLTTITLTKLEYILPSSQHTAMSSSDNIF